MRKSHLLMLRARVFSWCLVVFGAVITTPASAIPALQLGPDPSNLADWSYDIGTQTWVYNGGSNFDLYTYANATAALGGNGAYAWDPAGATDRYAYLVVATVGDLGNIDGFDLTVAGGAFIGSGYGTPPLEDTNSLGPHSIFDTYFEIYGFQFDGPVQSISDTQPGATGTGQGYIEALGINVDFAFPGLTGLHFDLFTVSGDGVYDADGVIDKELVKAFAPFSHDAQVVVPIPAAVWLFGSGLLGMIGIARRSQSA